MIKNVFLTSTILLSFLFLTCTANIAFSSSTKVELIEKTIEEETKDSQLETLLTFDEVESQLEISNIIENVKDLRSEVLDKLGANKDCYIVAGQVRQLQTLIKRYEKHSGESIADKEITKSKKFIEQVKKKCPTYKDFE